MSLIFPYSFWKSGAEFSPLDIPNIACWYDFGDEENGNVTYNASGYLRECNDRANLDLGYKITYNSSLYLRTTSFVNRPYTYMNSNARPQAYSNGIYNFGTPLTIFAVGGVISPVFNRFAWQIGNAGFATNRVFYGHSSNGTELDWFSFGDLSYYQSNASSPDHTNAPFIAVKFIGGFAGYSRIMLGTTRGNLYSLRGRTCELIIYNRYLSTEEVGEVVTYLSDKWSITLENPLP